MDNPGQLELSDAGLVEELAAVMRIIKTNEDVKRDLEAQIEERLIAKELAGEKPEIRLVSGESVSLGDEEPHFKYDENDLPRVHEWIRGIGLGSLIKEPKIHHASLDANLKAMIKETGLDIPPFIDIKPYRQLSKRGMR